MALELLKTFREKLEISRYKSALDLGFGKSRSWDIKQIEETSKTFSIAVFQYLIQLGRKCGYSDKVINDKILKMKKHE